MAPQSFYNADAAAVGQRIRQARLARGLSQRTLAFDGCSPAYLSHIEKGKRRPSLQLLRELARRLDVSPDYLETGAETSANDSAVGFDRALVRVQLEQALAAVRHDPSDLIELLAILTEALRQGLAHHRGCVLSSAV